MANNSTHPNHMSFGQGRNISRTTPSHIPKVEGSYQPNPLLTYEVTYEKFQAIQPITRKFSKVI